MAILAIVFGSILTLLMAVLMHELGHFLGGRLVGLSLCSLTVGPARLLRRDGKYLAQYNQLGRSGWGGRIIVAGNQTARWRWAVMLVSGPLGSLLSTLAAWAVLSHYDLPTPAKIVLKVFAAASAVLFLVSIYPARSGVIVNDGFQLIQISRSGAESERWQAVMRIGGEECGGVRPGQWNPALVRSLCQVRDGTFIELKALRLAICNAIDSADRSVARKHVERLDQLARDLNLPAILLESAFWKAEFLESAQEAAKDLKECEAAYPRKQLASSFIYLRAKASVLAADGDPKAYEYALNARTKYHKMLPNGQGGLFEWEQVWLDNVIERTRAFSTRSAYFGKPGLIPAYQKTKPNT